MSFSHKFHSSVLREYDIRGIVGETLSPADATAVGRVFGTIIKRKGGARRFADVLNQLDLNWYLDGMSAGELVAFLPEKEFARFRMPA